MVINKTIPGYRVRFDEISVGTLFAFLCDPKRFCIKIAPVTKVNKNDPHSNLIYNAVDITTGNLYSIRAGRTVYLADRMV